MEPREATGKETMASKRKNLTFLRPRLYMLERRKTDTVVDNSVPGDHSGTLRRSQSDRTEYSQKLQGNQRKGSCCRWLPSRSMLVRSHLQGHLRQRRKSDPTFPSYKTRK